MANTKEITSNGRTYKADFDSHEIYVYLTDGEYDEIEEDETPDLVRIDKTEAIWEDVEFLQLHDEVFGEGKESFEMESWNDDDCETYLTVRVPSPNETYSWNE